MDVAYFYLSFDDDDKKGLVKRKLAIMLADNK